MKNKRQIEFIKMLYESLLDGIIAIDIYSVDDIQVRVNKLKQVASWIKDLEDKKCQNTK